MAAPSTALAPRVTWRRASLDWFRHAHWIAICWIVVFWRLGYASLLDPDEAHYAEMTREMLHSGSWLVPLLNGQPFIDKPVLFHWLQGASVALLGETEFAARVPSAVAAIALFATTRWAGTALLGAEVGEWGAIMFATVPATFALASIALFDMVFARVSLWRYCLPAGGGQGGPAAARAGLATRLLTLAVMTKGPVALVLVALFFLAASVSRAQTRASACAACTGRAACAWSCWRRLRGSSGCRDDLVTRSSRVTCWPGISGTSRSRRCFRIAPSATRSMRACSPALSFRGAQSSSVVPSISCAACVGDSAWSRKRSCSGSGR